MKRQSDQIASRQLVESRDPGVALQTKVGITLVGMFILTIIGVLVGTAASEHTVIITRSFGSVFGNQSQTPFLDPNALILLQALLGNATASCTPPPDDPSLVSATTGTRANVNAAWETILAAIKQNVTNITNGCYFYGLEVVELRAGEGLGPVDICHAYVHIGIDLLHILYGFQMPPNIGAILSTLYDMAYPLTMFWSNTNDPATAKQQVIANAFLAVQCFTTPFAQCSPKINVRALATQFCNQYFASDDPNYYNSAYQAWLAFPFPGLMQRSGDNSFAPELQRLVSPVNLLSVLNETVVDLFPLKGVYILGDVLATSPAMSILLDALFHAVPRNFPVSMSEDQIDGFLDQVQSTLQSLDQGQTILVVGRYAEDTDAYNSVDFVSDFFPTPLFFLFSNLVFPSDNFTVTVANRGLVNLEIRNFALSWQIMNVVDMNTTLRDFDSVYSSDYIMEKFVASYLVSTINSFPVQNMNYTMQLLDTFMLKNVAIGGVDFGGHIDALRRDFQLDVAGDGVGFLPLAYQLESEVEVMTAGVSLFGSGAPAPVPDVWDYRFNMSEHLRPGFDQGSCNNCWAESATLAQSVRYGLRGIGSATFAPLSIAHVTSCSGTAGTSNGCQPSHPSVAFTFMASDGVVEESCFPTKTITNCGVFPCPQQPCKIACSSNYRVYKDDATGGAPYYKISGLDAFKSDLFYNGPFASCFYIPTNFKSFFAANPHGCYSDETAPVSGGHCVMAIGFDRENLYFRNSWGTGFANHGDFCIKQNMKRALGTAWFTNEGWGAKAGAVTTFLPSQPIPAGGDRTVQLILNAPDTIPGELSSAAPQPRPTPKPIPHRTPVSGAGHTDPCERIVFFTMIVNIVFVIWVFY